jgi:putative ABC transport system permease protein
MFYNYLKIAWRNLMKFKLISLINLFGLTLGLACCLQILAYIINELSYDRFNEKADRIYRVTRDFYNQNGSFSLRLSTISPPFAPFLKNDYPDIEKITRLLDIGISPLRYKDKLFNENQVYMADENFFDVFSVRVLKGNPKKALEDPFSIMLTPELARKYFGDEDPMNKMIRYNGHFNLKVAGIFQPLPPNAHMHPRMLISFNTLRDSAIYGEENLRTNWGNNSFFTFLLLPAHYPVQKLIASFPAFIDRHMDYKDYNGQAPSRFTSLGLQKLTDIHLHSHTDYEAEENGDIGRVYIFSAIAIFILLIACINYMNLSTARSALRAREIGIRKVVGAERKELIFQFLTESILLTFIATLLAVGILLLASPLINRVAGQEIPTEPLFKWQVLLPLILTPFVVGTISGLYPSVFLSSFQPVKTLKGLLNAGSNSISFRKALVVFQFAISIILIVSTLIVFRQLRYMQLKSLGYDKDRVITMIYNSDLSNQFESFRTTLLENKDIREVTRSSRIPTGRLLDDMGAFTLSGDSMRPLNTDVKYVATDYDFITAFGISMAAGRNFSRTYGTDTANFILNEAAVPVVGWKSPQDAIGKDFKYGNVKGHIIGIMKNFHFESMHQLIVPIIFLLPSPSQAGFYNNLSIKLAGSNLPKALSYIETTWKRYLPEVPFQYNFLDENFAKLYKSEQKQGTLFMIFASIAIFIACLGLFGLSAFAISQRIKEIGIRKVLGAGVSQIVSMIAKDFLILVGVAALIAFPISWIAMHNWLKDFAYRTSIGWWVFLLAGGAAALVAFITISFQTFKAAVANPAKSLRTE